MAADGHMASSLLRYLSCSSQMCPLVRDGVARWIVTRMRGDRLRAPGTSPKRRE